MSKLTFLYPGQGSQRVGCGSELRQRHPDLYWRYFSRADEVSGLPISRLCLEGPIEALTETQVAQPALFTLSLALTDYARQQGLQPDYVAGHSLGEYTAAVAAGVLPFDDGLYLVCQRGKLMAEIQTSRPGAMAAIVGLPVSTLQSLSERASEAGVVALANLNTPRQTVVSGEEAAVLRLMELARAADAEKVVRLQVGAGFHTRLMQPVRDRLSEIAATLEWSDPRVPVVMNVSGQVVVTGEAVRDALMAQTTSPVQWTGCVETMVAAGSGPFLELGPGRVLVGLLRQIAPDVTAFAADSPAKIDTALQGMRPAVLH